MSALAIYNEILPRIKRNYEIYEEMANQKGEDKRVKTGTKADKAE
jgi:hypothetical protein